MWLKKKSIRSYQVDIHSHLIPGIDDGVKTLDESIAVIQSLMDLGFKKAITTPHIHPSFKNSPDIIREGLEGVHKRMGELDLAFELEVAAEYYVDDVFFDNVKSGKEILSFGNKYVLVESAFLNKPLFFESCLFELKSKGYQPVLAHPERYRFLEGGIDWLHQLKESEILLQVTASSFAGFYGETPKKIAGILSKHGMIDFLGSDLHRTSQIKHLIAGLKSKEVDKLCNSSDLRNFELT